MIGAYPSRGRQRCESFVNFSYRVCLDGGDSIPDGFPENGCTGGQPGCPGANPWQVWGVYS